jgi:solute carrier family 40 (iron-regulated transporter), member 1
MADHHNELQEGSAQPPNEQDRLISLSSPTLPGPNIFPHLYTSHFLSTWNTRGFEFGAVLFLATIYPGTLLPMSVYALIRALSAIIFSPTVGAFIDSSNRLKVVRISIVVQRGAVASSCLAFWLMLRYRESLPQYLGLLLLSCLILFACVEKLCSIMNTIAVERDWVVVIGEEGGENTLKMMNSQMRRIDLFCKILSPLAIALIDGWSSQIAVILTLVINVASVAVEYGLIATVYRRVPALAAPKTTAAQPIQASTTCPTSLTSKLFTQAHSFASSLHTYATHRTFLPSFSLSLLYFTVISFAGQMTTYLLSIGLTSTTIGLLRTISTAFELSATFIGPYLMSRIGPVRAGIWSQSWLVACVSFVVGILWSTSSPTPTPLATGLFVAGVIVSRIGIWSFDLCAQIIIQDEIAAESRGSFSSMEASVRNVFELGQFAATIAFSRPDQFRYPALMTLVAVWLSASFYAKFVRDRRGHLLHMPKCLKGVEDGRHGHYGRGRYEVLRPDPDIPPRNT